MSSLVDSIFGSGPSEATHKEDSSPFATKVEVPAPREFPKQLPPSKSKDALQSQVKKERKQKKPVSTVAENPNKETTTTTVTDEDRTVFVGNLPLHYTRRALAKLFSDCPGKVESARIRSVATAGVKLPPAQAGNQSLVKKVCANIHKLDESVKSCVSGYVVFVDVASVEHALKLNQTTVPESDSVLANNRTAVRHIRVDRAATTRYDPANTVFCGNLPYQTDEESLAAHLQRYKLKSHGIRIIRDKETHLCKGFAYILLADTAAVAMALKTLHETVYLGKKLRVQVCGKRTKGRQGNNATAPKAKARRLGELENSVGALKRVLTRQLKEQPRKKRAKRAPRGSKGKPGQTLPSGVSKRAATDAKADKKMKKMEKRLTKGMGKTRK